MAETINQTLYDVSTPEINGNQASIVLANTLLANIFQGQIFEEGRGCTNTYSNDVSGAQIRIRKVLPVSQEAREVGASINGGSFNSEDPEMTSSVSYGIDVLTVLDRPIDIPQITVDLMDVDLTARHIESFAGLVNRNINAMTIAVQLLKYFKEGKNSVVYDTTDEKAMLSAIIDCNAKLDEGDEDNGIDAYPEDRVFITHAIYEADLKKKGVLVLGGSNTAQELLAKGQLSLGDRKNVISNGYLGDIDGVPVHSASNPVWRTAEKFLGLAKNELDKVIGYMASGIGTGRGIATAHGIKAIPSPQGQGVRLQPLVRMGAETFYASSVIPVLEDGYVSPVEILSALGASEELKYKASGSRAKIDLSIAVSGTNATPTFSVSGSTTDKALYVWSTKADATLEGFYKAYSADDAVKGTAVSGTAVALSTTGTYYLLVAVIAKDGTISVAKSSAVSK